MKYVTSIAEKAAICPVALASKLGNVIILPNMATQLHAIKIKTQFVGLNLKSLIQI